MNLSFLQKSQYRSRFSCGGCCIFLYENHHDPYLTIQPFHFWLFTKEFCCLVAQLCLTLCHPMVYNLPGSSVHGISQARILEWVAIPFIQGIFLTQGSNPGLLHCRQILYQLSHQGRAKSEAMLEGASSVH